MWRGARDVGEMTGVDGEGEGGRAEKEGRGMEGGGRLRDVNGAFERVGR